MATIPWSEIRGNVNVSSFAQFIQNYNETIDIGEYSDSSKWIINGIDSIRDHIYIYMVVQKQ